MTEDRTATKNEHILVRIAHQIVLDPVLAKMASIAVRDEVDSIYGYKKYTLEEIAAELEERLYNPTYLGCSLNAILGKSEVSEIQKSRLAESYLDVAASYLLGKLPKKIYEYWGADAEPSHVVEAAAYLAERKRFDWTKKKYLTAILSLAQNSSVKAKRLLLQTLVEKLNEEEVRGKRSLTRLLSSQDLVVDRWFSLMKEIGIPRVKGKQEGKWQLLCNLSFLIDAEGDESSAGALCRLSCLEKDDLLDILDQLPLHPFLRRTPSNRTMLYYDIAKVLFLERKIPFVSMVQTLAKKFQDEKEGSHYMDEPKLKALTKLSVDVGENQNAELLQLLRNALNLKGIETETRLALIRFLYENAENQQRKNEVLHEASRFKSGKIRAWASEMTHKAQ
jgi:hypothetical protein